MSLPAMFNDPVITSRTVFARNCDVRRIDRKTADAFLDANHIYGSASCRHCYGLFRRRVTGASEKPSCPPESSAEAAHTFPAMENVPSAGELVAVATFSNARRWEKQGRIINSYEWIRYASLKDTRVVGGMGKLLNAFIEERHPDDIMTYAISTAVPGRELRDGVESEGNVYRKLGFREESRRTFPSRLPADSAATASATHPAASSSPTSQLSTSIKFRLKLTDWE